MCGLCVEPWFLLSGMMIKTTSAIVLFWERIREWSFGVADYVWRESICRSDEQNHLVIAAVKLPNDERCFRADRYDDERNGRS